MYSQILISSSSAVSRPPRNQGKKKYSQISDDYCSIDEVTAALSKGGLESSNLIVGIDVTKSNESTGERSINKKSLHDIGPTPNPYEQAISIIGKTLSSFDEGNVIPCYGFGDATTHDQDVFSFYPEDRFCKGFEQVLTCYREIVPQLSLSGPTSFAPIIERAMTIVEQSGGQYHVLLIIAAGQVTTNVGGGLSSQERNTIDAIVRASRYPLSIVLVGVGEGPWDTMRPFVDNIPARAFDNFQFVNFTEIISKNIDPGRKEAEFAVSALMDIPSQYKATQKLGLFGQRTGNCPNKIARPLPVSDTTQSLSNSASNESKIPNSMTIPPELLAEIVAHSSEDGAKALIKFIKAGPVFAEAVFSKPVLSRVRLYFDPHFIYYSDPLSSHNCFYNKCLKAGNPYAVYAESVRLAFRFGEVQKAVSMLEPIIHLYWYARLMYIILHECDDLKTMQQFLDDANTKTPPSLDVRKDVTWHVAGVTRVKSYCQKHKRKPPSICTTEEIGIGLGARIKKLKHFSEFNGTVGLGARMKQLKHIR